MFPCTAPDKSARLCPRDFFPDLFSDSGGFGCISQIDIIGVNAFEVTMSIVKAGNNQPTFCVDNPGSGLVDVAFNVTIGGDGDYELAFNRNGFGEGVVPVDSNDFGVSYEKIGGRLCI
jgi:hypothetical protein